MDLVKTLKALSDENRLRILNLLRSEKLCVGELETILGMSQSNVSRHLTKLKDSDVIIQQKKAQWVFYRINHSLINKHPLFLELLYTELGKMDQCRRDLEELRKYQEQMNLAEVTG